MRILLINQSWLAQELRVLGHEVVTCGYNPTLQVQIPKRVIPIQEVLQALGDFSPEVLVFLDDSMPAFMVSGLDTCDIPSVFYSVDTHQHRDAHFVIAPLFDQVLVAQRDYIPHFQASGTPVTWFPLWAPRYVEPSPRKSFPAAFVGTLDAALNPRRVSFFKALSQRIPVHIDSGDYAEIFSRSDIVVNQTVKGDLNFRVFEAMMCGALLLTERIENGLLELFQEGTHLITYEPDNVDEVVERFQSLLGEPHRIKEIALAGREEILARHTGMHRAVALERILVGLQRRLSRPERHYASMSNNALVNRLLVELGHQPCVYAASAGLLAAEAGLQLGLRLDERETTMLIATCGIFDQITSTHMGAELVRRFYERLPENPLLVFAHIHSLLERGEKNAAVEVATQQFRGPSEHVCGIASDVIPRIIRGEIRLPPG